MRLGVTTAGKPRHEFTVEVAATPEQQERGLMFRETLGPDSGMIFPYDPPKGVAFWMKNTLIPLDLVFFGPDKKVIRVADNAVPYSEEPIPSNGIVSAVLEIPGGRAAELGIGPGSQVDWTR